MFSDVETDGYMGESGGTWLSSRIWTQKMDSMAIEGCIKSVFLEKL